jgi:hypothetical protein
MFLVGLGAGMLWGYVLGARQVHADYAERAYRAARLNRTINLGDGSS